MVLDKTGTITLGQPKVTDILLYGETDGRTPQAGIRRKGFRHPWESIVEMAGRGHGLYSLEALMPYPDTV